MHSTPQTSSVPKLTQKPPTSPDLITSPLLSDKKPSNFITKNIDQLKKRSIDIDLPNYNTNEVLESEPTPKSSKPVPKPIQKSARCQSFTRPTKKPEAKPQAELKQTEKSLTSSSKNFHQKDALIESMLKGQEEEARMSPVRSNTPLRTEERANKRSTSKAPDVYNEITTSLRSQEVLANKFIKEFQNALMEVEVGSVEIDLKKMILVMEKLRFLKNDGFGNKHEDESTLVVKLWKMIGGELTAKVQNLLCCCLNIMNLYSPNGHLADSECSTLKSWAFINGIFVYNSDEALKIHKAFYEFYQNRRLAPKKVAESQDLTKEYSFKPTINRMSRDLASDNRNRYGSLGSQKRDEFLSKKKEDMTKQRDKNVANKDETDPKVNFQPTLLARSGSKQKKPEIQAKSPILNVEHRKILNLPRKDHRKLASAASPKLEPEKIDSNPGFFSVRVQKDIETTKKIRDDKEKLNIFMHKKSSSMANGVKEPIKVFSLPKKAENKNKECLTGRSEILRFEDELSYTSPYLNTDAKSIDVSDTTEQGIKEFEVDDIADEGSISGTVNKTPALQAGNHAATLQLINFINDHNLSEDSAEKLLKIFTMAPKNS